MGGSKIFQIPGGDMERYILKEQENSPGQMVGLKALLDFLVAIGNASWIKKITH